MSAGLAFASFGVKLLGRQEEYRAAKKSASALKEEARQIGIEAQDRELMRRRELNKILSSQAAQFAGAGLEMSVGSPRAIMEASASEAQKDFMTDTNMTRQRQKQLRDQARAVKKAASRGAFIGVIGDALSSYQQGGGGS